MISTTDRPVLIIDVLNAFIRAYAAYPQMSTHGYQMGGCIGFLKTMRRIVSEMQPSKVVLVWESGGSSRRRSIFPDYKLSRRPEKLNRFYEDDLPDTEENRQHQLMTLVEMLRSVPVCQVYVSDVEGDDVVAYLCRDPFRNNDKIIASSDKDMYQLLDDKTKVYSFHKKGYVSSSDVLSEFRVTANNFALAKALCGDPGDNVPGIKGMGFKTVSRLYPFLGLETSVLLQDVLDYAAAHRDESAVHKRVCENKDDVIRNWKLVHLDGSMLSATQIKKVDDLLETFVPRADRMTFTKVLVREGIGDFDVPGFFASFNCIENIQMSSKTHNVKE